MKILLNDKLAVANSQRSSDDSNSESENNSIDEPYLPENFNQNKKNLNNEFDDFDELDTDEFPDEKVPIWVTMPKKHIEVSMKQEIQPQSPQKSNDKVSNHSDSSKNEKNFEKFEYIKKTSNISNTENIELEPVEGYLSKKSR